MSTGRTQCEVSELQVSELNARLSENCKINNEVDVLFDNICQWEAEKVDRVFLSTGRTASIRDPCCSLIINVRDAPPSLTMQRQRACMRLDVTLWGAFRATQNHARCAPAQTASIPALITSQKQNDSRLHLKSPCDG